MLRDRRLPSLGGWHRVRGASTRLPAFVAVLGLLGAVLAGRAHAQTIDDNLYVTNGAVAATAYANGVLYIGGAFSRVGPASGCAAPVSTLDGSLPAGFPKVNGFVNAVVPDGAGGWYLGGSFTMVGGLPRQNLAHVAAGFSVVPWNPVTDGPVFAIGVAGSVIYVGGNFSQAGGAARTNLAAIDAATGVATGWTADAPGGPVRVIQLVGGTVYVGGDFSSVGGVSRSRLAAVSSGGSVMAWDPQANGTVRAMDYDGSSTIYVGGDFSSAGLQTRSHLAALDLSGGFASAWDPSPDGTVYSIAVSGFQVYVGGSFGAVLGTGRSGLAAISANTPATLSTWDPSPDGPVMTIGLGGSVIYVGGQFASLNGTPRTNLAGLDPLTGVPTAWDPSPNDQVLALAVTGSTLYAGGTFTGFLGSTRNNLAALKPASGSVTSWNPKVNGPVNCLAVSAGKVYAGGSFDQVGGTSHKNIVEIDAASGTPTSFAAGTDGPVTALAVSGSSVYLGGLFDNVNGTPRSNLAAVKALNGLLRAWNPGANGSVLTLLANGTTIYAGGGFTSIGAASRNFIAAIDSTTGTATSWNPNGNGAVRALAMGTNGYLYAGGDFSNIGSMTRNRLAALSLSTGVASVWDPNVDGTVFALAASGTILYVGGEFNTIAGASRMNLAALNLAPSTVGATSWAAAATLHVLSLALGDSSVYVGGSFLGIGPTVHARIARLSASPEVTEIYQPFGSNVGSVSVTVSGRAFRAYPSVKLTRASYSDIYATQALVDAGGESIAATFDLTGAATGIWNLTVINPDGLSSLPTLSTLFAIQGEAAPQLQVSIVGPDSIRAGFPEAFDVVVENPGNQDATGIPIWVSGIPVGVTLTPDFSVTPPPQDAGEPDWSGVPATFTVSGGQYMPLVIPRIPPGTLRRRFILNSPSSVPLLQMAAAVAPPWGGAAFTGCLSSAGVISNPSCAGIQLSSITSYLSAHPQLDAMSGIGIWAKEAWQCEGAPDLTGAVNQSKLVLNYLQDRIETGSAPAGCEDALLARWRQVLPIHVVFSIDPNDKLGPTGTISSSQSIPYSIRFENLATATASTRVVTVVDQLSTSLDVSTLSLDAIDLFGTVHLLPAPGSRQYTHDVDLGHDNLIVRISANLDAPSRQLTWLFTTLDKTTLQPPNNTLLGFLPPNTSPPQGEGSVLFTIRPTSDTPNGATIQNGAVISFDGVAQNTPPVSNTVDATAPSSNVLALGNPIPTASFGVSWAASGSSNDLRDFTIYVAEDGGPYQTWKLNTVSTSDTYVPRPGGHTYAFYSVARDLSGNIEAAPPSPDAQTFSTTAVDDRGGVWGLALAGARPNPARGVVHVGFTLPSGERAALELMDVAGRRVARREVGGFGPGAHELTLDPPGRLEAGLYFLRLIQGSEVRSARVVLIR